MAKNSATPQTSPPPSRAASRRSAAAGPPCSTCASRRCKRDDRKFWAYLSTVAGLDPATGISRSIEQAVLGREVLQRGFRPRAEMLNHLGSRHGAEPAAGAVVSAARQA